MNDVIKTNGKGHNIITMIVIVLIIGAIGYLSYKYFVGSTVITSDNKFFSITIPGKYNFVKNPIDTSDEEFEYELSMHDKNKNIYIVAQVYIKEDGLKEFTEDEHSQYAELDTITNITDVKSSKINTYDAYSYSYNYIDKYDTECFIKVIYISAKENDYMLMLEGPKKDLKYYENDFDEIINSFTEK